MLFELPDPDAKKASDEGAEDPAPTSSQTPDVVDATTDLLRAVTARKRAEG